MHLSSSSLTSDGKLICNVDVGFSITSNTQELHILYSFDDYIHDLRSNEYWYGHVC